MKLINYLRDVIRISVLENQNIDQIEEKINQLFFENAGLVEQDATYLSNSRHISLIEQAVQSLQAVNDGLENGYACRLVTGRPNTLLANIGRNHRRCRPDELITQLFSQFCLGK